MKFLIAIVLVVSLLVPSSVLGAYPILWIADESSCATLADEYSISLCQGFFEVGCPGSAMQEDCDLFQDLYFNHTGDEPNWGHKKSQRKLRIRRALKKNKQVVVHEDAATQESNCKAWCLSFHRSQHNCDEDSSQGNCQNYLRQFANHGCPGEISLCSSNDKVVPTPAPNSPTTSSPTTSEPTMSSPTTSSPTSSAPSNTPTTSSPTSSAPSNTPTTSSPTTSAPSNTPTTSSPTSLAPSNTPTTSSPTTSAPSASPSLEPTDTPVPDLIPPREEDEVFAVWVNGPKYKQALGGGWPKTEFGTAGDTVTSDGACQSESVTYPRYTGYTTNGGGYCKRSSNTMNDNPHLVVHSGKIGAVFDAKVTNNNMFMKMGSLTALSPPGGKWTAREVYDSGLPTAPASLIATLTLDCSSSIDPNIPATIHTLTAKPLTGARAIFASARHGHAVSHFTVRNLNWVTGTEELARFASTTASGDACEEVTLDPTNNKDPTNANCNVDYTGTGTANSCLDPMYPICLGFQQGVSWGRCWKDVPLDTCQFQDEPWFDVTMWGDTLSVHLNWDFNAAAFGGACTAQVSWNGQQVAADTSIKQITMMSTEVNGALVSDEAAAGLSDLEVTGGAVLKRPTVGDILLEIPSGFATCGYDPSCGVADYHKFDFSVANTHPTEERTLRLIISRQFYPGNGYPSWTRSTKQFAEITGMSAMIWGDQTTLEPIGLPHQISKQWHNDVPSEYSANTKKADGSVVNSHWWTVNIIVHLPPNFSKDLSLALAYEKYRGVQSWSHSQLSLIGWSESTNWLWEEAALGMSGENFVIDPLGENTQAAITDVRPKLFDGVWKENVGGGDFGLFFDELGTFRYKKEMVSQIRTSGPCLSDALYTSITDDGSIKSEIQVSGARTDDIVRVFIHVRHTAMKAVSFKRFVFFQMGAEKYNYHPNFAKFAYGSQQAEIDSFDRTCGVASNTAGSQTSRHYDNLYNSVNSDRNIYREELSGDGPWWFAFEDNQFQSAGAKKVGDKGLIVRSYDAVFNGTSYTHPSFSMLCDKVELGTPAGVTFLQQGDYVDMRLEFLVMPLEQDLDVAVTKSGTYNDALVNSKSLEFLNTFTSARDRVKAHATPISVTLLGGDSTGATIESEYPIRLRVSDGFDPSVHKLEFRVTGSAIGYVPILIGNLSSSHLAVASGLWSRPKDVGAYSPETAATTARQVNHVRGGGGGTYEMVFNVNEMGAFGTVEYTDYSFGADPNNDIIIL